MSSVTSQRDPATPAPYHPMLLLVAALAGGIVIDRLLPLAAELWWLGSIAAIACWWIVWRQRWDTVGSCALLAATLAVGGAWHHDQWNLFADDEIGRMVEEQIHPIAVEGLAMNSPRWVPAPAMTALRSIPKGDETQLALWVTAVRDRRTWRPASGWAQLDVEGHLVGVRAGDRLRIMALGSRPTAPLNPGEFDFAAYQRSQRTWCRLNGPFPDCVTVVERGWRWSPRLALSQIRQSGAALLRRSISPRRATLAAAILLGAREQLDPERNEGFLVTGTIHILSISGLHVGILALAFWFVLRTGLVPQRPALVAAMLLIVAYAFLTDLQPPVVRATVLIVVLCLAKLTHRRAFGFNPLALAGIAVLGYQPASLFQAGPQLSFLAVAVMILFGPLLMPQPTTDPLDRLIAGARPWPVRSLRQFGSGVWRIWLTGALIWTISLPIVWRQYNLISPSALLMNTVIWIPISLSMYFGFATLLLGAVVPPLGTLAGRLCDWNLEIIETCIAWGRHWPGSYAWLPAPPAWWVGLSYVALGLLAVFPALRPSRRWWYVLPSAWFAVALILASSAAKSPAFDESHRVGPARHIERPLACSFVAVGHGVACVVELPDGRTLLYDAGKLGSPLGAVRPVSSVLWSRGIRHLDAIVLSHADSDHFNAVPELLERFSVGAIYVSPVMFDRRQPAVEELRAAIVRAGVPIREVHAGDRLSAAADVRLEVLHPPRKGIIGSDNANSIVLLVEYAGRRILLTGDLESPGMDDVLAETPLDCDAVLAPHHGSRRSDHTGFALWSTPDVAVISGARNADVADIEAVKDSYRARGAEVFHTAEDGCVRVEIGAGGMTTTTFRPHAGRPAAKFP